MARVPALDALGAGYNVFGAFESAESITVSLLDWGECEDFTPDNQRHYDIPKVAEGRRAGPAELYAESGWTFKEYCSQLNTKTELSGSYAYFSGSLQAEFSQKVESSSEYAYTTVFDRNPHFLLTLRPYTRLRKIVKPPVAEDLDQMEPALLFDTYGTHFISSLVVGTKTLASYTTLKTSFTKAESLRIAAEMSYKSFVQVDVKHTTETATTLREFNQASTRRIRVYGGRQELGTRVETYQQWREWADGAREDPVFIEFIDAKSLRPIWDLCASDARTKLLRESFKAYAESKTAAAPWTEDKPGPRITDVRVIHGGNSDIPPDLGFTKINQDLNQGAGGEYIYVTYKRELAGDPIMDLQVVYGGSSNVRVPEGYEKIDVDLNKGAGGQFIYLCKTRKPIPGLERITDLAVVAGSKSSVQAPAGFQKINIDLNKGAGGKFIYLCVKR